MQRMTCPVNGTRPISEFICGGELRVTPSEISDLAWAEYLFCRNGTPGIKSEWWCHTPSNTWFIAERDTATDQVLHTYLYQLGYQSEYPLDLNSAEAAV